MLTKEQINEIKATFSQLYDIDLAALNKDSGSLAKYVQGLPRTTKLAASAISVGSSGSKVFAPLLEAEVNVSAIRPDPRLLVRQIEANLDEAAKYLHACQSLRERFGDLAKTRSDVRFKAEEFFRLDEIHQLEIDNGMYELPWKEADDDVEGLTSAIEHASEQEAILRELFGEVDQGTPFSASLKEDRIRKNISDNAFITRNTANKLHDEVESRAMEAGSFRGFVELATWLERWSGIKATLGQLGPRLKAGERKAHFLHLDETFKLRRRDINRQLAFLQVKEHSEVGSELNYDERLRHCKELFIANLVPLIERSLLIEQGAHDLYGIENPIGELESGAILDRISVWLVEIQDAILKWRRTQRLSLIQFIAPVKIDIKTGEFTAEFDVKGAGMPPASLMRGVNFEFVGDRITPLALFATPPGNIATGNPLRFGRVCMVAPSLDLRPQHADTLWNGPALGLWKVDGVCPAGAGTVDSLILYIWVMSL